MNAHHSKIFSLFIAFYLWVTFSHTLYAKSIKVEVGVGGNIFSPSTFSLCLGDTINFVWVSGIHNIHITSPDTTPSSDLKAAGDTFIYIPKSVRAFSFRCDYHYKEGMIGAFTVNTLPTVDVGLNLFVCYGSSTTLHASGNGSFLWSPANGLSCTTCPNPVVTPVATTMYTVTATNTCGSTKDSLAVIVDPIPYIDLGKDTTQCGDSIVLNGGIFGLTYLWSTGETTQYIEVKSTQKIWVQVANVYHCKSSDTVHVTINPIPTITISSTDASCLSCKDGAAHINVSGGTGGYTYSWIPTMQTTSAVTGISPGYYTVCVTDQKNCSSCKNVFIGPLCDTIQTTFKGGNRQDGVMFDITARTPVTINGFDLNLSDTQSGNVGLKIYTKNGTYAGFEQNPSAWTLIDTVIIYNPAPTGKPTAVPVSLNISISSGKAAAFYITVDTAISHAKLEYTNGKVAGNVYCENYNLQFKEGIALAFPFGKTYSPRVWNGIIHYCAVNDVGVEVLTDNHSPIRLYPNPFTTNATLEINADEPMGVRVFLFSIYGQQLSEYRIPSGSNQVIITRGNLPSGLYFYKVVGENKAIGAGKMIIE